MSHTHQTKEHKERKTAEIAILAIAAGMILFMLGYSVYHAITASGTAPTITGTPLFDQVSRRGGFYVLPLEIRNETEPTAEDVRVTVETKTSDNRTDEKEVSIDFLPEHSTQTTYVLLKEQPTKSNVKVDVESYKLP